MELLTCIARACCNPMADSLHVGVPGEITPSVKQKEYYAEIPPAYLTVRFSFVQRKR